MTSRMRVSDLTIGHSLPACISVSTRIRRLPSLPPGCRFAKSSCLKPFSTSSVIASASPMASAAVVLAVGTRFIGQASSVTLQSSATSAASASVDIASPVTTTSFAPTRRMVSSRRSSSSVSPLYDSARIAAASVSSTLRASVRSAMQARLGLLCDRVDRLQAAEQRFEGVETERVLRVAPGARRLFVYLDEHPVEPRSHTGRRKRLDVFREAGRHAVSGPWQLQAVRDVEDHRYAV